MTVLGGLKKSCTAVPSRRNSGLIQTPNSSPARRPEHASNVGITTLRMVPGNVVIPTDRKSTRLNSSHLVISYAVFCLKKKRNHAAASSTQALFHGNQYSLHSR